MSGFVDVVHVEQKLRLILRRAFQEQEEQIEELAERYEPVVVLVDQSENPADEFGVVFHRERVCEFRNGYFDVYYRFGLRVDFRELLLRVLDLERLREDDAEELLELLLPIGLRERPPQ